MATAIGQTISGVAFPSLLFINGNEQRKLILDHTPFSIGRRTEKDLVISDPRVSRDHALLIWEGDGFYVQDLNSKHGTYVNGEKIEKRRLQKNDRLEFGVKGEACVIFDPDRQQQSRSREFLSQVSMWKPPSSSGAPSAASELETLTLFLEAARKLNTSTVLEEVLLTLIDSTLQLTKAERGYVFLKEQTGDLRLVAGRNNRGEVLMDDSTISRSILRDAVSSASEFLVTDNDDFGKMAGRESVVAHNLRTVICIPLRKTLIQGKATSDSNPGGELRGVLYLDSKFMFGKMSQVNHDILRAIATEAASLVENAFLVQVEEQARRNQQELNIAADIQKRLMQVTIPDVPFAKIQAKNISSKEIGGDFFDVIRTQESLTVVVTDVSGKGISAALLASILQGLLYAQLTQQNIPLRQVVTTANRFLCEKVMGEKYATLLIARLHPSGRLEYINCGHVPPVLVGSGVRVLENSNFPVGLLEEATFDDAEINLDCDCRLMMVTDGVTEAEDPQGEFFGMQRLRDVAPQVSGIDDLLAEISKFCAGTPLGDDCTAVQLQYLTGR
ncbi:MAG TPA: SpoIIE family protein phosphatase [Terriglobales bacterium]|nr:SpoIIE family protein phosphatase [Terriglobales bacterium]